MAGSLSVARSAHAAGSEVIHVALIGSGGRGSGAVSQLMNADENVKLIAVADAFEDRAQNSLAGLKKRYEKQVDVPDDRVFTGFDAYKQALSTDADLVVLATSPGFRPTHYEAAVKAGKRYNEGYYGATSSFTAVLGRMATYFEHPDDGEFLHEIQVDPDELKNFVADPTCADTLQQMRARCDQLRDQLGGPYKRRSRPKPAGRKKAVKG